MDEFETVLKQRHQPMVWPTLLSVFGHGTVLTVGLISSLLMSHCNPRKPIIDPQKSIEVAMVVLPKSKTRMPDRAARAKVPRGTTPKPSPKPPPIRESDLSIHKPDVAPKAGKPDRSADRKAVLENLMRENLLENLLAPDGPRDRDATDPNSDATEAINALGPGVRSDPEYARYISKIQALFMRNFKPLNAIVSQQPDLLCVIHITVDDSGKVTVQKVVESSGNPSFDASATSAAAAVTRVPLPPDRFRVLMTQGYTIKFHPP
jgi:TonB family protein